jgi:ferredoxin
MKICEICGDEFQEVKSNQRYCKDCGKNPERARQHYVKAELTNRIHAGDLYKVKEVRCIECGRTILTTYNKSFCSTACSEKHRIKHARYPKYSPLLVEKTEV